MAQERRRRRRKIRSLRRSLDRQSQRRRPSPVTGTIRELLVKEGETVATGTPIAVIDEVGAARFERIAGTRSLRSRSRAGGAARRDGASAIRAARTARRHRGRRRSRSRRCAARRSPAVRRLAREHRIDIRALKGTGTNGRVTADDVLGRGKHRRPPQAQRRRRPHPRHPMRRGRRPTRSRFPARRSR